MYILYIDLSYKMNYNIEYDFNIIQYEFWVGGESMPKHFKNNFQKFCYERGLTYEQVAELLDISKYTAYAYYRGVRLPNRRTMRRFKVVFGVNPNNVFDYEIE